MSITAQGQNTQSATLTTEHTLLDIAVAGAFQAVVDLNAMAAGDVLELRWYAIVLTGGTRRQAYYARFEGVQNGDKIVFSEPIANELTDSGSLRLTLLQTVGTGRSYPWKVLKLG